MRTTQPKTPSARSDLTIPAYAVAGVLVVIYLTMELGSLFGTGRFAADVITPGWTGWDTIAAVLVAIICVAVGVVTVRLLLRRKASAEHVDSKADSMGSPDVLSKDNAERKAIEGRMHRDDQEPGLMLGRAVIKDQELWSNWRDGVVVEAGPGAGKTTSFAVPMIINSPGVCVVTSNKRDAADAVKLTCEARGTCFVFDPQRIADYHAGHAPDWWWNPLAGIASPVEAFALAKVFADASAPTGASKNAYFDTAGPQLLAHLILAAAVDGRQLDQVYLWIADPNAAQREAVKVLRDHVFPLPAAALKGACNAAPEEKSGLFGTAAAAVSFLTSPAILEWVTDTEGRPQFVPEKFVNSGTDTLISLSREGVGTAGPLTTALTVAVMTAAEKKAQQHPHGRLPTALTAVLDEVANVCRWQGLPAQFSHYGSAGICLVAILQNWSQGVTTWRREGMQQLWDAATIRVVGAGIADRQHLADVAQLIDQRWMPRRTAGSNHGDKTSRSVNDSFERELIMSVGDLAGLPAGRMIVIPSGGYPILAKTVPWFDRPEMVEQVAESIRWNEPA